MEYLWICNDENRQDIYAAFRGSFYIPEAKKVAVRIIGASWFRVWIDGNFLGNGPHRFEKSHPQYEEIKLELLPGKHVVSAQVHNVGITTRMLSDFHPFFACEVWQDDNQMKIEWKCIKLNAYESKVERVNPQLGWIEYCDIRKLPLGWQSVQYDDLLWDSPAIVNPQIEEPQMLNTNSVKNFEQDAMLMDSGPLASTFGYEKDDIPAVFFLRDLECKKYPQDGIWRRYDLGKVKLFTPSFTIEAPEGTIVEFSYAEQLTNGRVAPYITLSAGSSCNLDHYICREGIQTISPITPRGGRYVELHVLGDKDKIIFHKEKFIERSYYDKAEGSFETHDALLNKIWEVGVETFRSCAEDTIIDNPTRERGQWTGDVVSVGMDICSVAYSDYGPLRRGLQQSAWCAREDGIIAGMSPGGVIYLSTYALQWIEACYHYYTLTGDISLLEELYSYAKNNIDYFYKKWTKKGLIRDIEWCFIDWGYVTNEGPSDMAINIYLYNSINALIKWCKAIDKNDITNNLISWQQEIKEVLQNYIDGCLSIGKDGWSKIGFHRTVLSLGHNFYEANREKEAIEFVKNHYLNCFPNNPYAPRLGKPSDENPQLITPYFSHYAFPKLINGGEMDFVLEQYRKCWGWALEQNNTTWVEVFDTRWSHCHQWSGCPTWQLSRYVLGLNPRFDIGENCFEINIKPGSLLSALGKVPNPKGEYPIEVQWLRKENYIEYKIKSKNPITIIDYNKEVEAKNVLEFKKTILIV